MANYTFLWDEELEDSFGLIAIHCSAEAYKTAYLLNKHTNLNLKRCAKDLDIMNKDTASFFPIFSFADRVNHIRFYLIQNKSVSASEIENSGNSSPSLFATKEIPTYFLPQFKNVDYFLKIENEYNTFPYKKLISDIQGIKQMVSVYQLDTDTIKSKNNLIFDLC